MLQKFTKHCEPFFLALANDFGLVSVCELPQRVITAIVAPTLCGISSDDVLAAGSLTITFNLPTCYALPLHRVVSTRVKRHFDAEVKRVRERSRDDADASFIHEIVRERLHQVLQRDPVCRVYANPRENAPDLSPDLLQRVCEMYAQDAVRNVFLQTGQDDQSVNNVVRDWLLCGFDKDDETTDILTHVQMALEPSLDTGAIGFKKLNAICHALTKLSGNHRFEHFDLQDRSAFVEQLETHLNERLWEVMSSLVDAAGQALAMDAWEQRLADWLAAYEFVSRHFPPGKKGTKKHRSKWHAMSAVRVIVRSPAVDSQMRRNSVQMAIVRASGDDGEADLCTVRTLIDETVALFGDNEVAKRGLLSEIVMWWTDAAIKHKATDLNFCTCLEVINGTEAAHGVAMFPAMKSFLLRSLCECVAPGWPNGGEGARAPNPEELASYNELEAALCKEMAQEEPSTLASLLFNKIVHDYQNATDKKPGGISAADVIECVQSLATLQERADRDRVQLIKKDAAERWLAEAAGRYCSLPLDVHERDEMASDRSPLGAAMSDALQMLTAPERRENLLLFMHVIEQRAGSNHLQELLQQIPFGENPRYPWVQVTLEQLKLEIDPSGANYARQLPFAFATAELPNRDGMPIEIRRLTELYTEFSACFEQCVNANPPEFQPLADLCARKVAETPACAPHLKMHLLLKVYYDNYSQERLDKLGQLCDFLRGAQFQCLDVNAEELSLFLCALTPATAMHGYRSATNTLAKVFDVNATDADDLLLRDILVNLAAVTMGAGRNHHLSTFAFSPEQLRGTWGFIAGGTQNIEASHYDSGCKIKADGAVDNDRVSAQAVLVGIMTCFGALCWPLLCYGEAGLARLNDEDMQGGPRGVLSPRAIQGMSEDQDFRNAFEATCHFVAARVKMATQFLKLGLFEPADNFMIFYNNCLANYFVEATAGVYQRTYAAQEPRAQAEAAWEQRVVATALAAYPVQEEYIAAVRQQKANELSDHVDADRHHINENIINLKCPRCGQVFNDWKGCFALYCTKDGCNCGFCAWCLAEDPDNPQDAHQHVKACESNPKRGSYFGTDEEFEACHVVRRELKIREYLMTLDQHRRKRVAQRCRKDWEDLRLGGLLAEFLGDVDDDQDGALLPELAKIGQAQDTQVTYAAFLSALQNGRYADAETPLILKEFVSKRRSLRLMELVVPIAKLYFFIHENLGHMYSEAESRDMTLRDAVEACVEDLVPKDMSRKKRRQAKERILAEVERGIDAVNEFHSAEGGTLQPGACDETQRFDEIGDQTKLLYVLTDPKNDGGPNILFHIMSYLVRMQNGFLRYCHDHCTDPVITMDFTAVKEEKVSIFDVLATSGGLCSVTNDNFESVCPAFCSEDPVLRSNLMSLTFDFQQCQRFATSLLAGYALIDERSLGTVYAFKTNRATVDEEGQLLLHENFCAPMEIDALEQLRARLGGLSEEALQSCNIALEKYLLSMLRSEPAYTRDDIEDPDLVKLSSSTIAEYAETKLGDITELDCRQALEHVGTYPMRFLRAIALENSKRYGAATGANMFAAILPAFRKALNPPSLEDELRQLFDAKVCLLEPNEADSQRKVDLLEHTTKFLCEICEDSTSGVENEVLRPLAEYCGLIGYNEEDDLLLFTETGHKLPPDVKVENITEVCTILLSLREHYARRALDTAASIPWQELIVDFVEDLEPEPVPDLDLEPEPEPEDPDTDTDTDDDYSTPRRSPDDERAALVPTRSQREDSDDEEGGLFNDAMNMETPQARAEREAISEAKYQLEEGQEFERAKDLDRAIIEYKEALGLENLRDEKLIGVLKTQLQNAEDALKGRDSARADMHKWLEQSKQFVADKNYESAIAVLQQGTDLTEKCHDTTLSQKLAAALNEAQVAKDNQDQARAAAELNFNDAQEAMQKGDHEAALKLFTAALAQDVNDDARRLKYKAARQVCEQKMATSAFVVAELELSFEDCSEAYQDKSEVSVEPLVPWMEEGAPKVDFKFVVLAIDDAGEVSQTDKFSAPLNVCKSIELLQKRTEKAFKKKKIFKESDTVVLLSPSYVMLSQHVPATGPAHDLASRAPEHAIENDYVVHLDKTQKRVYHHMYAAREASLASVTVELDGAYKDQLDNNEPITLQFAKQATWGSIAVTCARHFGVQSLGACCLKHGNEILELRAACEIAEGKLILAPATKEVVVRLVRSDQLANGQTETKKLSSSNNSAGQSVLSFASLLKSVAEFAHMSSLEGHELVAWSEDTQSAQSEGELCERSERTQALGIVKASDVLRLSFSFQLAAEGTSITTKLRQCLPDTQVGAAAKQVLVEAQLKPAQCLVFVSTDEGKVLLDLNGQTTAAEIASSGGLNLEIYPGARLLGRDAPQKVPRGQTFGQLCDQLGLDSSRLAEVQTRVVPGACELVETSWRKNVQLGAVRSAAVCTVDMNGQECISFDALATIAHVRRAFKLPTSHKLAWRHCILADSTTLQDLSEVDNDGKNEDEPSTVSLTSTPADEAVIVPVLHPQADPADRPYNVHVIRPDETSFSTVKEVACMHFGLPHPCIDVGVCIDTADGTNGSEFDGDDSLSEYVDEYGDDDSTMAVSLTLNDEAIKIECELRTGEDTDVVATKELLINTSMPFRRVRSYAKRAFALESSHLDAEHGCVAIDASSEWMQLVVEECYQEVDEEDYGLPFADVGGGDIVQLHATGELRLREPGTTEFEPVEPESEPELADNHVEPEPEPELEPGSALDQT
eukprot:COSAG02_NODE_626_length_19349_cov_11.664468_11_plen_2738_part_01